MDDIEKIRELIGDYIENCQPIHWVSWMTNCADPDGKRQLESVLFENGSLRNLTDPNVREEVLNTVRTTPSILEVVIRQLAEEVEAQAKDAPQ